MGGTKHSASSRYHVCLMAFFGESPVLRFSFFYLQQVQGKFLESTNCSTGVRKPDAHYTVMRTTERATFVLSNIDLDDEAVYSIRLGGTIRNMENKTLLIVTGKSEIPVSFT